MSPSAVPPPPPPPPQDFTASNLSVSSSSPRHRGNSNSNNYLASPPISIWSPSASTRCSRDDFINSSYDDDAELQRVFSFDEWLEDNKENSSTFCPSRKFFSFDECVDSGNLFDDDYDDYDYYGHHEREDSHSRGVTTTIGQSDENENDATTPDGFGSISDVGIAQSSSSMKIDKSLLVSLNTCDDLSSTAASDDSPLVIYNCSSIPRASDLTADDKTANETAERPTNSKPPPIKTIQLYLQENDFNRYRDQIDKDIDALSTTAGSTIEDNVLSPTSTKDVSTLTTSSTTEVEEFQEKLWLRLSHQSTIAIKRCTKTKKKKKTTMARTIIYDKHHLKIGCLWSLPSSRGINAWYSRHRFDTINWHKTILFERHSH